jgi:AcrR family transcriptional regulator
MARTRASEGTPLGREEIVAGAMRVTKEVGLDRLTMRALATELRVTPMALYHHVPNKDALLQLVADAVIGEIDVPPPDVGPWDVRLAALAHELRARVSAFPGVGAYLLGSDVLTPGTDALVTSSVAMLESAGFSARDAALAFTAVHNYLLGRLSVEASLRGLRLAKLRATRAGMPEPPGARLPADDYFDYGLAALLRGLRPSNGN